MVSGVQKFGTRHSEDGLSLLPVPWVSAKRLEVWSLQSSEGSFTQVSRSWHWLSTAVLSSSLHGFFCGTWASSQWGGQVLRVRKPVEGILSVMTQPWRACNIIPTTFVGQGSFKVPLRFEEKEKRPCLSMEMHQCPVLGRACGMGYVRVQPSLER